MRCPVVGPDVGLDLDDPDDAPPGLRGLAGIGLADEASAEEGASCVEGRAGEDRPSVDPGQASQLRIAAENVSTMSCGKIPPTRARMFGMT